MTRFCGLKNLRNGTWYFGLNHFWDAHVHFAEKSVICSPWLSWRDIASANRKSQSSSRLLLNENPSKHFFLRRYPQYTSFNRTPTLKLRLLPIIAWVFSFPLHTILFRFHKNITSLITRVLNDLLIYGMKEVFFLSIFSSTSIMFSRFVVIRSVFQRSTKTSTSPIQSPIFGIIITLLIFQFFFCIKKKNLR